jgi:hypothetical protein
LICKAGKKWGMNKYVCCKCGKIQFLNTNEDILQVCSCGNEEFISTAKFNRSEIGNKQKLDEVIRILEISIFLCEVLKINSFYNVIAVQLRILLCESNNNILNSKLKKPMLHPHTGEKLIGLNDYELILETNLFDRSKDKIELEEWLCQEICWSKHWKPITIRDVIKAWANKNGGAHIDSKIPEREIFIILTIGEGYLLTIAKYLLEILECDLEMDVVKYFIKPFQQLFQREV